MIIDNIKKAFLSRENHMFDIERMFGADRLTDIRYSNFLKGVKNLPKLEEIVAIQINKCLDTSDVTITLIGVDGKKATLWGKGDITKFNIPIRSITN